MTKTVKKTSDALKTPKLSNKPSQAIKQAVADLTAVEKLKKQYIVDMNGWHDPEDTYSPVTKQETRKCAVCFAGSVIARAGNDPAREIYPESFPESVANKLIALDSFRLGDILGGLETWGITKIPLILQNRDSWESSATLDITEYEEDPKQFKKDMLEVASNLEKLGL